MPMQISWTPPRKRITHIIDGYPASGSPKTSVFTTMNTKYANAARQTKNPATVEIESGMVENDTIPSTEYLKSFQKDHFVSPETNCQGLFK